jgi:hypothetical protein
VSDCGEQVGGEGLDAVAGAGAVEAQCSWTIVITATEERGAEPSIVHRVLVSLLVAGVGVGSRNALQSAAAAGVPGGHSMG